MIDLDPATEHEMVLAFLRAEMESTRYKDLIRIRLECLGQFGFNQENLLEKGDPSDLRQNEARAWVLADYRGYRRDSFLFRGFPVDATWRHVALQPNELGRMRYANVENWLTYSGGTRKITDVVSNLGHGRIPAQDADIFRGIEVALRQGKRFPELIGVEGSGEEIILLEGHSWATAYIASGPEEPVNMILGNSASMAQWAFY